MNEFFKKYRTNEGNIIELTGLIVGLVVGEVIGALLPVPSDELIEEVVE